MHALRVFGVTTLLLGVSVLPTCGQAQITVNDQVHIKFGALGQFQGEWLEDPAADDTQQNLFIRRIRLLVGGQVTKNLTFFMETDAANLGKTTADGKNISPQMIIQDAYAELKLHDALAFDVGLMFVPFARNYIQAAGTLLPIDYGAYTYAISGPTQSSTGRDTGVQAKGYVFANRLEYRLGVFQGARDTASHRAFRTTGRAQVQLLEPESPGFFYTGTYLGARRVAAFGAAFDEQEDYSAYDVDVFFDHPLGPGAVTSQLAHQWIEGDPTFQTLPKQRVVLFELGYYVRSLRITPVYQFTRRNILDTTDGDETRWSLGLNYLWKGHNANVKAAWGKIDPRVGLEQNQFTAQLQFFYY